MCVGEGISIVYRRGCHRRLGRRRRGLGLGCGRRLHRVSEDFKSDKNGSDRRD